jgi:hypothetical protein
VRVGYAVICGRSVFARAADPSSTIETGAQLNGRVWPRGDGPLFGHGQPKPKFVPVMEAATGTLPCALAVTGVKSQTGLTCLRLASGLLWYWASAVSLYEISQEYRARNKRLACDG